MIFQGSAVAMVTPFTKDGVNCSTYQQMLDYQIAGGTQAIVALGTTGEPATMSEEEKIQIIQCAKKHIAGRVPLIVGTGSNCTAHAVAFSKQAEALGADALLLVTPYYNKCSQEGLLQHYSAIADAVHIPMILYNVPGRTGVNLLPETLEALCAHENIVAIKEASGNLSQISEIARRTGGRIDLYSGNDDQIFPILSMGGQGVISVLANILPKETQDLCLAFQKGDWKQAREMQLYFNPLVQALFMDVNPIPVKMALAMMGFAVGELRLPLCRMNAERTQRLEQTLKEYHLI